MRQLVGYAVGVALLAAIPLSFVAFVVAFARGDYFAADGFIAGAYVLIRWTELDLREVER